MPRPTRFRLSTVALVVAALALSAPQAHADPVRRAEVVPLPRTALAAAVAAATTPQAISIARTNFKQGGQPEPATITVAGSGLPVYTLAPDFVRGDPAAAPGRFAYVAVVATADDGRQATMAAVALTAVTVAWRRTRSSVSTVRRRAQGADADGEQG
ncbi:hypothetical protein [Actinokineospora globicatena]|uniref:hypothetical protein n=1 Tax=Actinokineospora globicatena TaxID=103729 RepID=UPI0020A24232|nr:hypothetical protein [Actinokineospora globicatena]MCP2306043.1 hypothetical protein [Actinokineospora globicatena]GLW80084.1 hypothetical protein Aglo01_45650 [Actinokineospora globicatena]GLW86913.1 hypothetical protein Aglo02_45520 [Actinokineospora globicatena]